jgi:hypothetical protein
MRGLACPCVSEQVQRHPPAENSDGRGSLKLRWRRQWSRGKLGPPPRVPEVISNRESGSPNSCRIWPQLLLRALPQETAELRLELALCPTAKPEL